VGFDGRQARLLLKLVFQNNIQTNTQINAKCLSCQENSAHLSHLRGSGSHGVWWWPESPGLWGENAQVSENRLSDSAPPSLVWTPVWLEREEFPVIALLQFCVWRSIPTLPLYSPNGHTWTGQTFREDHCNRVLRWAVAPGLELVMMQELGETNELKVIKSLAAWGPVINWQCSVLINLLFQDGCSAAPFLIHLGWVTSFFHFLNHCLICLKLCILFLK
jgi:hypothetical protein